MAQEPKASTLSTIANTTQPSAPKQGCDLVYNYDWDVTIAKSICLAESNGNTTAYGINTNGTSDSGLMQINSCHSDLIGDKNIFDPNVNMDIAYQIYKGSGFTAWSAYNNGRYERFL